MEFWILILSHDSDRQYRHSRNAGQFPVRHRSVNNQYTYYHSHPSIILFFTINIAFVRGVCNFLGSVSLQQKSEATDGPSVTAQFYLAGKGKYILKAWGQADPKHVKRRKPEAQFCFLSLYVFFFSFPSLPYVNWASQEAVCFTWGPHSGPWTFLCSIFMGFSLLCLLATAILDSFFLF